MPFEPLGTDEKLDQPQSRERDMDSVMLSGCTAFVATSLLSYGLAVWPFFIFSSANKISTLIACALYGLLPAVIFGLVASRRFGVAAAGGFLGGALATGIFLFLRLKEVLILRGDLRLPQPEFPDSWMWLVPAAWTLACFATTILVLPKKEFVDL